MNDADESVPHDSTVMTMINDIEARLEIIHTLSELAEVLDGDERYFRHVIIVLGVISTEVVAVQAAMAILTTKLRERECLAMPMHLEPQRTLAVVN
jgi:hypothetical protein